MLLCMIMWVSQVLKSLMAAIIASRSAPDLAPQATTFCDGMCRHFALLFASGVMEGLLTAKGRTLLAIDAGSGSDAGGLSEALQESMRLKELSPLLFLDALVEVGLAALIGFCASRYLHL